MIILSHRGYWKTEAERNTRVAFQRSFSLGFGTETDVRDLGGRLVISHDPPVEGALLLEEFLALVQDKTLPLAMNVKADGLAGPLREAMDAAGHQNWFAFDMSLPDTLHQCRAGSPVFLRVSEYEPWPPSLLSRAKGIWLDAFNGSWWGLDELRRMMAGTERVCIVSPELHKRPHMDTWNVLKPLADAAGLMLCTDLPEDAGSFFGKTAL